MIKTGSKFFYGLAALAFVTAIAFAAATGEHTIGMDTLLGALTLGYKGYVGDHVGYSILIGLAGTSLFLGIFLSSLRDSDADAVAQVAGVEVVPEVPAPSTVSYWPVVGAFSIGAVAVGLAVGSSMFIIGMIGLTITTVEWAVRAWSDRATGDPEVNASIRNRLMHPIEIPGLAVLGIGGMVLAVSRILLALPLLGSFLFFGLVPVIILGVGTWIVLRPKMSHSLIAAMLLIFAITILAGGVFSAIAGEREHEVEHEEEGEHGEEGLAPLPDPGQYVIQVGN